MASHSLWEHSKAPRDLRFVNQINQSQEFEYLSSQTESLYRETAAIFSTDSVKRLSIADRVRFVLYGVGAHYNPRLECVHHAFSDHVRKRPEAIAVEHSREGISYQDLDRYSHELARRLRSRGVYPGQRVCLLVQRSIAMVVAIFAT